MNKPRAVLLGDLLPEAALPAKVAQTPVRGLSIDSRSLQPGQVFIALQGRENDGRQFVAQAIAAGASCVLREAADAAIAYSGEVALIDVVDLPQKVSAIAAAFYGWPAKNMAVLGVTGTNGKTSCVLLLCDLLRRLGKKTGLIGTLGYGIHGENLRSTELTTPDPIACQRMLAELLAAGAEVVAMEASSHAIAQFRLEAVAFHGLVFTNLSRDHLDYHGDMGAYEAAKLRLFTFPGVQFFVSNGDVETGNKIEAMAGVSGTRCITYGLSEETDVRARDTQFSLQGIEAELQSPWGRAPLQSALVAPFNLSNLLAVIACALAMNFPLPAVLREVRHLQPVRGRLEKISLATEQGVHVFIDYAHTPDGLLKALQCFAERNAQRLWLVFGCGGDRDKGKRPLMGEIAGRLADRVLITSDNPRSEDPAAIVADIYRGVAQPERHKVQCVVDRRAAIEQAIVAAAANDIILVAGKGHEDYQLVQGEKHYFDDAEVIKQCLQSRCGAPSGGAE